jgi:hypothetical protein
MLRRHLLTTLLAGLLAGLAFASPAEARKRARTPSVEVAKSGKKAPKKAKATSKEAPAKAAEPIEPSEPPPPPQSETAPVESKAPAPAKARVYTFSGLDVNGNLKAPQLLFFRGRVKQELDTSNPEKRSFLKELERTADAKGL